MRPKQTAESFANDIRKLGMKYVIIPIFIVAVLGVVIVSLLSYVTIRYSTSKLSQNVSESLTDLLTSYMDELVRISADERLEAILRFDAEGISVASDLYRFINAQPVGGHFFLFDFNGENRLSSTRILSSSLVDQDPFAQGSMRSLLYQKGTLSMKINHIGSARSSSIVLSIEQEIVRDDQKLGTIAFELNPSEILEYISPPRSIGDIVITNSFYTNLLHSRASYIDPHCKLRPEFRVERGAVEADGKQYYIIGYYGEETDLWVYTLVEYGTFTKVLVLIFIVVAVLFVLAIISISLAANRIVTVQAGSIDDLQQQLQRMKLEDSYRSLKPINSEFVSLETSYNELIESIQELIVAREEEARLRQEAEIKQLGSSFNAHFIFNTLEVIRITMKEDIEAANQLIYDFSRLLRYSIDSASDFVLLIDDIQYIESYLSMNAMRLDDFSYTITLSSEAEEIIIPKLSIQPLVENSLQHPHPKRGLTIGIEATVEEGMLVVRVTDNGSGIDMTTLNAIHEVLEVAAPPNSFYGLYNVHRRLRLSFGSSAGLTIRSGTWGTVVTMRLPVEYVDD